MYFIRNGIATFILKITSAVVNTTDISQKLLDIITNKIMDLNKKEDISIATNLAGRNIIRNNQRFINNIDGSNGKNINDQQHIPRRDNTKNSIPNKKQNGERNFPEIGKNNINPKQYNNFNKPNMPKINDDINYKNNIVDDTTLNNNIIIPYFLICILITLIIIIILLIISQNI